MNNINGGKIFKRYIVYISLNQTNKYEMNKINIKPM